MSEAHLVKRRSIARYEVRECGLLGDGRISDIGEGGISGRDHCVWNVERIMEGNARFKIRPRNFIFLHWE